MRVVFRCDASRNIGTGHVRRCLTLADELRNSGNEIIFMSDDRLEGNLCSLINSHGYQYIKTNVTDIPELTDLLIVDHYDIDYEWEVMARQHTKKIMVIDDLANRKHDCDVLLDQTYGRAVQDYRPLTPDLCVILTGSKYALLRPQFAALRQEALIRRQMQKGQIQRVLISPGSTNVHNITTKILQGFTKIEDIALEIDVVLGRGANCLSEVEDAVAMLNEQGRHQVRLNLDVKDMAALMTQADLAIGGGGTTSWERCCLGLPTLLIELADNQREISEALAATGAVINLGHDSKVSAASLAESFYNLYNNPAHMLKMSDAAASICDGRGAQRIAPFIITSDSGVSLQLMELEDSNLLYSWQCQPDARRFSRNPAIPDPAEHSTWFQAAIENPDRALYKVTKDEKPVGMLRLDRYKDEPRKFEISILIDKAHHGQGIAAKALAFIRRLEPSADFIAEVLPENKASERLFLKSGFVKIGETFFEQKGAV